MLKGNAIVGQSGGPTAAINATLAGVIRGALKSDAIDVIYGAFNGVEGMLANRICDLGKQFSTEENLALLENTPAAALGSCRRKLPALGDPKGVEVYEALIEFFKRHNIRYLFYIGGNDSMDTVAKLSDYLRNSDWEMRVMGVPKTIDNDLMGTDHTPGFGSAAKYIAASMQDIIRDTAVYTVKAVTIIEIMGRDAGWLAAASALTRRICGISPDFVYLPERVFNLESFYKDIEEAFKRHTNVVVAVSEGIKFADGSYVGESAQSGSVDVFGHKYLSGAAKSLEIAVRKKFGCKVRSVELNILQRCASHILSATDIAESAAIGSAAVSAAVSGESGKMMCFIRCDSEEYSVDICSKDISEVANRVKNVPDEFINCEGNNVTEKCIDYLLPLIQGEPVQKYEMGLPKHITILK